jgi:hypothetical protein
MLMKFIYTFLFAFFVTTFGFFFVLFPFVFLLKFVLNNLSDIDWLLTTEAWNLVFQTLWKEIPKYFGLSIFSGVMSGAATVIVYLFDRFIVPDLRTRFFGLGILACFLFFLFCVAKYYGFFSAPVVFV